MKANTKLIAGGIIIFLSGVGAGIGTGYFLFKKKFENKANKEIDQVKAAFIRRLDELEGEKNNVAKLAEDVVSSSEAYKSGRIGDNEATKEALKGIGMMSGIANSRVQERVDYTLYSKENSLREVEYDPAGDISPSEDDDEEDEEDKPQNLGDGRVLMPNGDITHTEEFVSDRKKEPYEITDEEFGTIIGYSSHEMLYYMFDNVLADENNEIVEDRSNLVGNVMEDTNFTEDNRLEMCIRNDQISADFRIGKARGSYSAMPFE